MKSNYRRGLIWLGLAISAVFLYLAFREINYADLWQTLQGVRIWWLVPGLLIYFGGMVVRAWRWQYLLKPLKRVSIGSLFQIIMIGYMGNNVFPLRMGEVLRAVVLKRRDEVSISGSLATIVVEKIFDAVVVVGFVLLNLGQLARLPGGLSLAQVSGLATWAAVIFLVGLAVFVAVAMFPKPAQSLLHGMILKIIPERFREPVIGITDKFLEGLMSLRSPVDAVMIMLTSILVWLMETGLYWSVGRALNLDLTFSQLLLLNGLVNMVLLIPAAPGGLGTFDAAGRAVLEAFAIPAETALGYTLILRVAIWVPITLLGTVYFIREGLKWTVDVQAMQAQAEVTESSIEKG
ncbi:MAG: lysylphosphatidylglycerol synthase transmembrane domain-containing protein [Brevefilum sp.]